MGFGRKQSPPQQVSSTVSQQSLPDYAKPYYRKMMSSAEALMGEQYQPYQAQRIAGFEPEQMGAFEGIRAIANRGMPGVQQGMSTASEMASGFGGIPQVYSQYTPGTMPQDTIGGRMGAYQNPYQEAVLDRLQRRAVERFDEGQAQRGLQAAQQGAFGGSRAAIQDVLSRRNLEEQLSDMEAQQLQRGFGESARLAGMDVSQAQRAREMSEAAHQQAGTMGLQAQLANQRAFEAQQARRLQAAGLLPKMSATEQMLDLQRMAALRGVGGEFQGQQQQMMDQGYQDFINQRDYPRQNLAFFQQLLSGLPVTPSSEVMKFEPRPNPYAQMMGMGLGGMQMLSGMKGLGA